MKNEKGSTPSKWFSSDESRFGIENKELFLDNDFLNRIYKDEVVFKKFVVTFSKSFFIVEKLVSFEFLKSLFMPADIDPRIKFLDSGLFLPATMHQTQFRKILDNAIVVSQIYGNTNYPGKLKPNPSFIDLYLTGRLFLNPQNKLLITGNKRDFPPTVFDTIDVITIENEVNAELFTFYLLKPNETKFKNCEKKLKKAKKIS